MTADMSRQALLEFLDYAASKGLMNSATVSARKAAVNKVLGILNSEESSDVTAVNLDHLMDIFFNLHRSEYKPESMAAYKSRVKSSIDEFVAFQSNPLAFRPAAATSARRAPERRKDVQAAVSTSAAVHQRSDDAPMRPAVANSIMPIPIRTDLTIFVQGLPFDLTRAEANKIANVIRALAFSEEE